MAAEALEPLSLAGLLAGAGLRDAVERTYAGQGPAIHRVVVRVLRFTDPAGAERYLDWLAAHAREVVGDATAVPWGPGLAFLHEPDGCCAKEQPLLVGAWRRGAEAIRVIVAGPGAGGPEGRAVLERVRARLGPVAQGS